MRLSIISFAFGKNAKKGFRVTTQISLLLLAIIIISSNSVFGSSASFYYSDGPWMGKVIDAETKEPIQGTAVVAIWQKVYATPAGGNSYFFNAIETLTDQEGKFYVKIFKAFNTIPLISSIRGPYFLVFKPEYTPFGHSPAGYEYFRKYFPNSPLKVDLNTLQELFKKGITIELFKLKTKEERLESETGIFPLGGIPYNKLPKLMNLINLDRKNLGLDVIPVKGGE